MITAAGLWTPDDPEKRAGETVEAFLLRRAAQHPPLQEDAPEGRPDPAEIILTNTTHTKILVLLILLVVGFLNISVIFCISAPAICTGRLQPTAPRRWRQTAVKKR